MRSRVSRMPDVKRPRITLMFPFKAAIALSTAYVLSRALSVMGSAGLSTAISLLTLSSIAGSVGWKRLLKTLSPMKIYLVGQLLIALSLYLDSRSPFEIAFQAMSVGLSSTTGYYAIVTKIGKDEVGLVESIGNWGWLLGSVAALVFRSEVGGDVQASSLALAGISIAWMFLIRDVRRELAGIRFNPAGIRSPRERIFLWMVGVALKVRLLGSAPFMFRRYSLRTTPSKLNLYAFALFMILGVAYPEYLSLPVATMGVDVTLMLVAGWVATAIFSPMVRPGWRTLKTALAIRAAIYFSILVAPITAPQWILPYLSVLIAVANGATWAGILITLNWLVLGGGEDALPVNNTFRSVGYLAGSLLTVAFPATGYSLLLLATLALVALNLAFRHPISVS